MLPHCFKIEQELLFCTSITFFVFFLYLDGLKEKPGFSAGANDYIYRFIFSYPKSLLNSDDFFYRPSYTTIFDTMHTIRRTLTAISLLWCRPNRCNGDNKKCIS